MTARISPPPDYGENGGVGSARYHAAAIAWLKHASADLQLIAVPAWTGMDAHLAAAWTQRGETKTARRFIRQHASPEHALGDLLEHVCGRLYVSHINRDVGDRRATERRSRQANRAA